MKFASIIGPLITLAALFHTIGAPRYYHYYYDAPTECTNRHPIIRIQIRKRNIIDLTYVTNKDSVVWPTDSGFKLIEQFKGFVTDPFKYFFSENTFSQPDDTGTHMDAPIHFSEKGNAVHQVGLNELIGEGRLVDLTTDGNVFNESLITVDHLLAWENKPAQRKVRTGNIVLIRTGYGDYYNTDRAKYWGTNKTGSEAIPFLNFPGLHPDAAKWLVDNRCIAAVGIDTPSIDAGQAKRYLAHEHLAAANIPIFENVANLDMIALRKDEFKVIALPYKIEGGSAAPVRIIAVMK